MTNLPLSADRAHCARHQDAEAVSICPRCGDHLCSECIAHGSPLCLACTERDPLFLVAPLPFEARGRSIQSIPSTLLALLKVRSSAPSFARGNLEDAARFFAITSLSTSLLAFIIPYTRTLLFGSPFELSRIGSPGALDIVLDVVRASLLGAVQTTIALTVSTFVLLLAARFRNPRAWVRFCLYWAWVEPANALLGSVGSFAHPKAALGLTVPAFFAAVLSWIAAGYVARRVGNSTRVWSVVTGLLAMTALCTTDMFMGAMFRALLGLNNEQ